MHTFKNGISVAAFLIFAAGIQARAECPLVSGKETLKDCPWADIGRDLKQARNAAQAREVLARQAAGLRQDILEDARLRELISLWGISSNQDANLPASPSNQIVPVSFLRAFAPLWKTAHSPDYSIGHAGLNHTYGYLFSTLLTPFGYKRARYVDGEIEQGFGFSDGVFGPTPAKGTLFSNLTAFLAAVSIDERRLDLRSLPISDEVKTYPYAKLKKQRIVERVQTSRFNLETRVDIIPFVRPQNRGTSVALLVYSIDFQSPDFKSGHQLITAFPGEARSVQAALDPKTFGTAVEIRPRYNAVFPVAESGPWIGERFLENRRPTQNRFR